MAGAMADSDPRYATFPPEPGVAQLRWYIESVASGALPVEELIRSFRSLHETLEQVERNKYASKEEARLIWDVLWALEFYSPDPSKEQNPEEWNDAAAVWAEVKRVAERLKKLGGSPRTTEMRAGDPRFETFPIETHVNQLRWYLLQTAKGVLTIHEFLKDFRDLHEAVERNGPPEYATPEEARAIWDVLWAVEFCSLDVSKEDNPEDWYIPEEVLAVVKRAAEKVAWP